MAFQPTLNTPSRVGVFSEPKRTSIVETTLPSIIQARVRLSLLMHMTRPVMQRGSGAATSLTVGGRSSSAVGFLLELWIFFQVLSSTPPVASRPFFDWKDFTAAVVFEP